MMVSLRVFGAGKIAGWRVVGLGLKRLRREFDWAGLSWL